MCWKCGTQQPVTPPVSRDNTCSVCGADTRSCKNCVFYSPSSHYDCRETVDEAVRDKERANFCENFSYNINAGNKRSASTDCAGSYFDKTKKAKSDFDALFK